MHKWNLEWYLGVLPHPVAVTTRTLAFFAGDPCKNTKNTTVTGSGSHPKWYQSHYFKKSNQFNEIILMYCIHLNVNIWCAVESGFAVRPTPQKKSRQHLDFQPTEGDAACKRQLPHDGVVPHNFWPSQAGSGWVNQQSIIKHTTHGVLKHKT